MPQTTEKSVCILLPTLNEEKAIVGTIQRINAVSQGRWKVVLADSCSGDRTQELARSLGAEVISVKERGKGRAVGIAFGKIDCDYLVMLDADCTYAPEDIPAILRALQDADVVLGSRFAGKIEEGAMQGLNRFGNRMLTIVGNLLYGGPVTDLCTGMWGLTKKAYKGMSITAPHFELEANLFIEARRNSLKIAEVPISYSVRLGEKKLTPLHGLEIGLFLLKKRVL